MHLAVHSLPVVEAGALQSLIINPEAQRSHQMQPCAGVGGQPDDVAGVGCDFRLVEDDVEQLKLPLPRR